MESKSIYSSEFFHLYNDRSNLACVYREVLEEISTDVSNSTQISQDTSQGFQCELMHFPSNFHKINHLSHSVYIHFMSIISKKKWCRIYNIHSEIASKFYNNQKETASNALNMTF